MELKTDVSLVGTAWNKATDALAPIFKTRTHYMLYMLSLAIGIMYDQRVAHPEENGEEPRELFDDGGVAFKRDVAGVCVAR